MAHVPHLYVPGPWHGPTLSVDDQTLHHLQKVLRRGDGSEVSYTDGAGCVGSGVLESDGVRRGEEQAHPPLRPLTMHVAAPRNASRARFIVEKLAELGVDRLCWISTSLGGERAPSDAKTTAWLIGALEQSRGAFLMSVEGPVAWPRQPPPDGWAAAGWVVADPSGGPMPHGVTHVVIGPEGGWIANELPDDLPRVRLGERILRTETAAVVAAGLVRVGR